MRSQTLLVVALLIADAASSTGHGWLKCDACRVALAALRPVRGVAGKLAVDIVVPICVHTNGTGECHPTASAGDWGCNDLCNGMMPLEAASIEQLAAQYSPEAVCSMLGACPLPSTPPAPTGSIRSNLSDTTGQTKWPNWPEHGGQLTGTFVHITDLHVQMDYTEGANTDCGQPICCRGVKGQPSVPVGTGAAKFGDFACDLSPELASSMFDAIGALEVTPDFLLNTGDDPAHDVWAQTHKANLAAIGFVTESALNMSFGRERCENS